MKNCIRFVVFSVICALLVAPTAPVFAMTGGFGGKPSNPDPSIPRSKDIFIYSLKGGESKNDEVLIANNTDQTQTIHFYPTDADISNTGAFTCKQRVEPKTDVGSWIKLAQQEVTLASGTSTKVPFVVTVPQGVEPGEHDGCLAFEPTDDDGQAEGSVRIHTRSAVRVAITIPGDLRRTVDITSFAASTTPTGQWNFLLSVKNTGNVSADTKMSVRLTSLFGQTVYSNEGTYPVIAGQKYDANYTDVNTVFWGGLYRANASISYDKNPSRFTAPGSQNDLVTKQAADQWLFIFPSPLATLLYCLIIILIILLVSYWMYRRREARDAHRNWQSYTIKEGDTVEGIADAHSVRWKKLAKINNLKAPYTVVPGEKIQVPKNIQTK